MWWTHRSGFDTSEVGQPRGMARDRSTSHRGGSLSIAADFANLAAIRAHVVDTARETGAPADAVEALELAVSELATNVIQHDGGDVLTVVLEADDTGWTLDVSNADGLTTVEAPRRPDPSQRSGRGLFLVDALMDRVELFTVGGTQHLRCVKLSS